jgi:hypothetical protein
MKSRVKKIVDGDEKYVPLPPELNQKSDEESIVAYLMQQDGNFKISGALREKLIRYEFCAAELRKNPSWFFVAKKMQEKYGLSENQSFRYCEATTRIYNTISRKQYVGRDFHISNLLSEVVKLYHKCIRAQDFKTAEKLLRDRSEILEKFYGGFEAGMYDDLQIPSVTIGFYPELTNVVVPPNWEYLVQKKLAQRRKENELGITDAEVIPEA